MLMQAAQFLDHDMSLAPEADTVSCCTNPHAEECLPILIPDTDPFFSQIHNQTCMEFKRAVPYCPTVSNSYINRENLNVITGLLDSNNVYGSDDTTGNCLRSFQDGKLVVDSSNLLPQVTVMGQKFVQSGDARAPEMPSLSTIHALWMREHNRVCDLIKSAFPLITIDELLYQLAKRIVNAEFQNIVYSEQIPIVEGPSSVVKFGLALDPTGSTYDPNVNPSILAEFSGASNRYGHSMVQGTVEKYNIDGSFNSSFNLADNFLNPAEYNGEGYDMIMGGLTRQKSQKFDRLMVTELTQQLFHPPGASFGLDLAAFNIQRGRDMGLPSYAELYEFLDPESDPYKDMSCWERRPKTFTQSNWNRLKQVYRHPQDIDLFSGGLLETRKPGEGVVGPLFATINSMQMKRLKDGDRFFFTHTGFPHSFNTAGRLAIMQRKMSDIICDNTDIQQVPANAFLEADSITNPLINCPVITGPGRSASKEAKPVPTTTTADKPRYHALNIDAINMIDIKGTGLKG